MWSGDAPRLRLGLERQQGVARSAMRAQSVAPTRPPHHHSEPLRASPLPGDQRGAPREAPRSSPPGPPSSASGPIMRLEERLRSSPLIARSPSAPIRPPRAAAHELRGHRMQSARQPPVHVSIARPSLPACLYGCRGAPAGRQSQSNNPSYTPVLHAVAWWHGSCTCDWGSIGARPGTHVQRVPAQPCQVSAAPQQIRAVPPAHAALPPPPGAAAARARAPPAPPPAAPPPRCSPPGCSLRGPQCACDTPPCQNLLKHTMCLSVRGLKHWPYTGPKGLPRVHSQTQRPAMNPVSIQGLLCSGLQALCMCRGLHGRSSMWMYVEAGSLSAEDNTTNAHLCT